MHRCPSGHVFAAHAHSSGKGDGGWYPPSGLRLLQVVASGQLAVPHTWNESLSAKQSSPKKHGHLSSNVASVAQGVAEELVRQRLWQAGPVASVTPRVPSSSPAVPLSSLAMPPSSLVVPVVSNRSGWLAVEPPQPTANTAATASPNPNRHACIPRAEHELCRLGPSAIVHGRPTLCPGCAGPWSQSWAPASRQAVAIMGPSH